mmetsp:Transcript_8062/g.7632  ORF Transcript_8062/g.7632 Transcript_8062/m.7632 type:complete len:92 (-) Transcript_8062:79-354(-)
MGDFDPSLLQGFSALMRNLEEESKFSQCNEETENDSDLYAFKQDGIGQGQEPHFISKTVRNTHNDISIQFQDISRISSSSDSEKEKEVSTS